MRRAATVRSQPRGAEPGDDLVLERVGPGGPLARRSARRASPGPKTVTGVAGAAPARRRGRRRSCPWRSGRRPGGGRRAPAPRRGWTRAAAGRRRTRAGAGRAGWRAGRPGVPVADRGAGATRADLTSGAVRVSAGRSAGRARRVDADQPGADPAHRVVAQRVAEGGRGRGEVAVGRAEPAAPARPRGPRRSGPGPARWRVAGAVGAGRGGPSRRRPGPAPAARRAGPRGTGPPTPRGRRRRGPCPVSRCRCTRAPGACGASASRWSRPVRRPRRRWPRRPPVGVDRVEPAQDRRGQAGGPERQRLVEAGDARAGWRRRQRGPGHVDGAVTEPVGLDDRHQLAGRAAAEEPGVRGDGVEVDVERGAATRAVVGHGAAALMPRRASPRSTGP